MNEQDRDSGTRIQRKQRGGEVGKGKESQRHGDGKFDFGEHTMQYTVAVLLNCTLEAYIILLTNVSPIN